MFPILRLGREKRLQPPYVQVNSQEYPVYFVRFSGPHLSHGPNDVNPRESYLQRAVQRNHHVGEGNPLSPTSPQFGEFPA